MTDSTPAVSIVMPAYNAEKTIVQTISSVLAQTCADFELLVINDGSKDSTAEVVAAIADSRIRLHTFPNGGPAASRNRGIERARSDLIAFLDADDLWTPDKLESQMAALARRPEAALVYSFTDCIDEADRFIQHGSHVAAEGHVYELLVTRNFINNGSAPMVRKAALDAVGLFDESVWGPEDWDLWLRLAHRFEFACVPRVQVLYRVSPNSISANVERQVRFCRLILTRALDRLPASAPRDRLEKTALANIYRYIAVRLVETATTRADGRMAADYWWRFVRTTPTPMRHAGKALAIGVAVLALLLLPRRQVEWLRNRATAWLGRQAAAAFRQS